MEVIELNIRKLVPIMLLTFALTFYGTTQVYATEPKEPHPADPGYMWIEPSNVTLDPATNASVGFKFNVTVWANASVETKGWQFWLLREPEAYINATRAGYTAGAKSEFLQGIITLPVIPVFRIHNATHDRLDFGEAWLMGPYRSPGYGSLCWIEFEVVNLPPGGERVEIPLHIRWAYDKYEPPQTYLLYSDASKRPLDVDNGLVVIIPEFTSMLMLVALFIVTTASVLYTRQKKKYH